MTGLTAAIVSSIAVAALSTVGDAVWATWIPVHRPAYGLAHGTVLFAGIGLALGLVAGRAGHGALWGAALGFAAAGTFYLVAPLAGAAAMFVAWCGVWILLSVLHARLAGRLVRAQAARGVAAAVLSGIAFYLVSGIWMPFDPAGWDYAVHFGAWTVAFLPGFGALLVGRSRG